MGSRQIRGMKQSTCLSYDRITKKKLTKQNNGTLFLCDVSTRATETSFAISCFSWLQETQSWKSSLS